MTVLRQSTARTILVGPVLDSTGAAKTDEVVANIKLTKNGTVGAANGSATLTHDHAGKYLLALTTSDTDTVGVLEVSLSSGTNDMPVSRFNVVEEVVFDSLFAASAAGYQVPIWSSAAATVTLSNTVINDVTTKTGYTASPTAGSIVTASFGACVAPSGFIVAESIATGAITNAKFAAGAIDAAAIANGAIDAATFAADVDAEILSYLVDDATRIDASALNTAAVTTIPAILADTGTDGVVVAAASKTGYTLTATTGLGNQTANITGNLSGSVGSVTGAVGSVTGAVGSVTGNVGGNVTGSVGSVVGHTNQTADVATLITTVGVAGAGLTALAPSATALSTATWTNTKAGYLDAAVSTRSTYAGADTAGTTTLLSRVVGTIAAGIHNPQSGDSYARIGAAGASLTAVPWNAAWDAEVQSECTDALNAYDPPTNTEMEARTLLSAAYATASNQATIAGYLDTEIAAILGYVDCLPATWVVPGTLTAAQVRTELATELGRIDAAVSTRQATVANLANTVTMASQFATMVVLDGAVYDFTAAALAAAPSGSGSSAADIADAVLDEALSGHVAAGSLGKAIADTLADTNELQTDWANGGRLDLILDARASQASVDTIDGIVDAILVDTGTTLDALVKDIPTVAEFEARTLAAADYFLVSDYTVPPTAGAIADAVWDEATSGHVTAGTFGKAAGDTLADTNELQTDWADGGRLDLILDAASAPSAAAVADAVWDELLSGHVGAGTAGSALATASSGGVDPSVLADAIWDEALSGHATAGTAGKKLTDLANADLSGVATAAELAKVPKSDSNVTWNATALASINAEVDEALNTAIPGSPTADSINERVAAMDGKIVGTLLAGNHTPQTGNCWLVVNNATYGNAQIHSYLTTNLGPLGANATEAGGTGDHLTAIGDTRLANLNATVSSRSSHSASDVASLVLATPANKLSTDASGYVTFNNSSVAVSGTVQLSATTGWGGSALPTSFAVSDKTGFKLASDGLASVVSWTVAITGTVSGNSTHSAVDVVTALGTGSGLTALATAAELAKVPKSDSTVTWNATALASIQSEANDALTAFSGDTGITLAKALEMLAAFMAGKVEAASVGGVTTYSFKKRDGSTTSFTSACLEADGTRETTGGLS